MGVAAFDTYTAAKRLRAAGFNENQAEAAVVMVREAVTEGAPNTADLEAGQAELRTDVTDLKTNVARIEARVERIESDVTDLKVDVARIGSRVERIEANMEHMATKEDVATASKETSHNLLRVALALGAMLAVGFSAMLAVLA